MPAKPPDDTSDPILKDNIPMSKSIATVIALALTMTVTTLSYAQKKMPAVRFMDTDNTLVTNKDIAPGKPLLLIYFRSDCDHCLHTAQVLKEQAKNYPATLWMVSAESIPVLRTFEDMTGLYDVDQVTVLQDYTQKMHTWFDFSKLPFIVLYDKQGKQLKTFDELPPVASVKNILMGK